MKLRDLLKENKLNSLRSALRQFKPSQIEVYDEDNSGFELNLGSESAYIQQNNDNIILNAWGDINDAKHKKLLSILNSIDPNIIVTIEDEELGFNKTVGDYA